MSHDLAYTAADGLIAQAEASTPPIPVDLVRESDLETALSGGGESLRCLAGFSEFKAQEGRLLLVPSADGKLERVMFGLGKAGDAMAVRALAARLPPGDYALATLPSDIEPELCALAWALGRYVFDRYKGGDAHKAAHERPRLAVAAGVELEPLRRVAHACALARDMVNTPAIDMGPRQIEAVVRTVAEAHGATISVVEGEALLAANYPAVHAVGRAAGHDRGPRMIELSWSGGDADAPQLCIVGKGVAFDTGGLDIKPSVGMRYMKKDMGGAAHALALARMVMGARLPVRLTLLIPAVENAISGDAVRPGDVVASRKGLSIEIGNTDAEGRVILADALARAGELSPDLTIDLATLTGAARVALGPEVVPFYTADEALAAKLAEASRALADPVWRMPLWAGYTEALSSDVADLANDPAAWAQAGSVTAALFLQRFAPETGSWVHLDIFAWNGRGRPGWPAGAEAQAIRALFRVIAHRYPA